MNDQMREALHEFLAESIEGLDQLDRDLVELEHDPSSTTALASVFRIVHTIKGSGGILGFGRLEALTHAAENLLSQVRFGALRIDREITDALLATVDVVRSVLTVVEATGHEPADDHRILRRRLNRLQDPARRGEPDVDGDADGEPDRASHGAAVVSGSDPTRGHISHGTAANWSDHPDDEAIDDADRRLAGAGGRSELDSPGSTRRRLGEVLRAHGVLDDAGLMLGLTEQSFGDPRPLGQILQSLGIVTAAQLDAALREQEVVDAGAGRSESESTVRVDVHLLDDLMNLVGELVLTRNQLVQMAVARQDADFLAPTQRLHLITSQLQRGIMKTRLQPIGSVLQRLPQTVHDVALACGKQVRLVIEGGDTELDRTVLEALNGPLTHLVRNAVDHGIESPEVRAEREKEPEGTLFIRAFHESGKVVIDIIDDGGGLDPERLRARAVDNGLMTEAQAQRTADRDIYDVIFAPGFSTAASVTNISGRGVGMDVVKTNIERVGGSVELQSQVGRGTTVRVRIPLTTAIVPALVVMSGTERYVIPQVNLVELVRLDEQELRRRVESVHGSPVLRLRGRLLPLVGLDDVLSGGSGTDLWGTRTPGRPVNMVVVQADEHAFGLILDEVLDTQEIVVKPLGPQLRDVTVFAGATIMGDGRLALILDVHGLARQAGVVVERAGRPVAIWGSEQTVDDASDRSALVIVRTGGEQSAVPLGHVSRLEQIPAAHVERSNGRRVVQYYGRLLPLIGLGDALGQYGGDEPDGTLRVLVHTVRSAPVGLVVESIVDITEAVIDRRDGRGFVTGTAVVGDRVTDVIDTVALLDELLGSTWGGAADGIADQGIRAGDDDVEEIGELVDGPWLGAP